MKLGDKVRLDPKSEFAFEGDLWNPLDVDGVVSEYRDDICHDLPLIVTWDNGVDDYGDVRNNSYNERDLILVS